MNLRVVICAAVAMSALASPVLAQSDKETSIFNTAIPRPTGRNGYEELVMAGAIASANKPLQAIVAPPEGEPPPTLSVIRKTLENPDLVRARSLLRLGLSKPIGSPRESLDDETLLPEFAGFRQLTRMLSFQMYVDCADGRMSRAIDTLRDCLRFGYVIQTDTLISGLVGVAVDAIAMRRFQDHLDQLSASDCDQLLKVVNDWLRLPDPMVTVMNAERYGVAKLLRKYRNNPDKLVEVSSADPMSEEYKSGQALLAAMKSSPGGPSAVMDQAAAKLDAQFETFLRELSKPTWERRQPPQIDQTTVAGRLCEMLSVALGTRITDRYTREQAEVQLMGVYAAVRRYRWEHLSLPMTLQQLNLGKLALDPFTGKPFSYLRKNDQEFEVSSVGPVDLREESGTSGQRVALTLPRKR